MADDHLRRSTSSSGEDIKAWWLSLPNEPSIKSTRSKGSGVLNADAGSAARIGDESQQQSVFHKQEAKIKAYSSTRTGLIVVCVCFCAFMAAAYFAGRLGLWDGGSSVTASSVGGAFNSFRSKVNKDLKSTGKGNVAYNALRQAAAPAAKALAGLGARHRREAVNINWDVRYGIFSDDVALTNISGFDLHRVVFSVYIVNAGSRSFLKRFEVDRIESGKTHVWSNALSVPRGSRFFAELMCDELK